MTPQSSAGGTYYQDVQCKKGELVVGGGYQLPNSPQPLSNTTTIPNIAIFMSEPIADNGAAAPDGATPTGWHFGLYRTLQSGTDRVTVYALCAVAT